MRIKDLIYALKQMEDLEIEMVIYRKNEKQSITEKEKYPEIYIGLEEGKVILRNTK